MKNHLFLFVMLMLFSCKEKTNSNQTDDSSRWFDTDTLLIWNADASTESRKKIYRLKDSLTIVQPVINGINQTWPEGKLVIESRKDDTLKVRSDEPDWLTEKIGNTGAEQYLCFAAMNLLEVKGVRVVCFILPQGSHAAPGCWSNEDFRDWKENN
jgi:hypothetical protein